LPLLPAPLGCPALPYFRQDLGKQQTQKQELKIIYLEIHVLSRAWMKKTLVSAIIH
jgi:hypothetical protein